MERKYEVRIFDYDTPGSPLIRRATTYDCTAIRYKQNFYTPGSFEIEIPLDAHFARAFQKYRLIEIGRRFAGLIQSVQFEAGRGADTLTVSGVDLLGMLAQRITVPPGLASSSAMAGYDGIIGASETVIKHFVRNNTITPAYVPRRIPGLALAQDQGRGIANDKYLSRYDVLTDVIGEIGREAKLGLSVTLGVEDGSFLFDVVNGVDRSKNQQSVPPVVISVNRRTAASMQYSDSDAPLRNAFYTTMAGASFADEALTLTYYRAEDEASPPAGIRRLETHMEISATHPTPGQEYNELKRLALVAAGNHEGLLNFSADVNMARVLYGEDYFLGDTVTVENLDWGITMDAQVVNMEVEYNGAGESYKATFGTERPSIMQTIQRAIKKG